MKSVWISLLALLSSVGVAQAQTNAPIPEPEMWSLIAVVAIAFAVSRMIRRK